MKHVRIVTKDLPARAYWFEWIGQFGDVKAGAASPKQAYINALWGPGDSIDPNQVGEIAGINW